MPYCIQTLNLIHNGRYAKSCWARLHIIPRSDLLVMRDQSQVQSSLHLLCSFKQRCDGAYAQLTTYQKAPGECKVATSFAIVMHDMVQKIGRTQYSSDGIKQRAKAPRPDI